MHMAAETMIVNIDLRAGLKNLYRQIKDGRKKRLILIKAAKVASRDLHNFLTLSGLCQFCAVHSILYRICCPGRHKTLSSKICLAMP